MNYLSKFKEDKQKEYEENYLVGHINEFEQYASEVMKEDSLGNVHLGGSKGSGDISVYNKEGKYPHCHIRFSSNNEHDCCIMIESANYFQHTGKDNTLKNTQMKEFVKWCNQTNKKYSTPDKLITNHTAMKILWNKNNPTQPQTNPNDTTIPNYQSDMGTIQNV